MVLTKFLNFLGGPFVAGVMSVGLKKVSYKALHILWRNERSGSWCESLLELNSLTGNYSSSTFPCFL